jgi:hypothetical protein
MDAHFYLGREHEAPEPQVRVVVCKQGDDASIDRAAPRLLQAHQEKSVVGSQRVPTYIREVVTGPLFATLELIPAQPSLNIFLHQWKLERRNIGCNQSGTNSTRRKPQAIWATPESIDAWTLASIVPAPTCFVLNAAVPIHSGDVASLTRKPPRLA